MENSAERDYPRECVEAPQRNSILSVVWTAHAMSEAARARVTNGEERSGVVGEQDEKGAGATGSSAENI